MLGRCVSPKDTDRECAPFQHLSQLLEEGPSTLRFDDYIHLFDTDNMPQKDETGVFFVGYTKRIRCKAILIGGLGCAKELRFQDLLTNRIFPTLESWLQARTKRRTDVCFTVNDIGYGKVHEGKLLSKGRLTMADIHHRLQMLIGIHTQSPRTLRNLVLRYNAICAGTYDWDDEWDEWERHDEDDGEWTTMWTEEESDTEEASDKIVTIGIAVAV